MAFVVLGDRYIILFPNVLCARISQFAPNTSVEFGSALGGLADVKPLTNVFGQLHGQGTSVVGFVNKLPDRLVPRILLAVRDDQTIVAVDQDVRIRNGFRGDDSLAHPACFDDLQLRFEAVELGITQGCNRGVDEVVPSNIGIDVSGLDSAVVLVLLS